MISRQEIFSSCNCVQGCKEGKTKHPHSDQSYPRSDSSHLRKGAARLPPHHFSSDKRFQDRRLIYSRDSCLPGAPGAALGHPYQKAAFLLQGSVPRDSTPVHNLRIFALRYFPQPRRIQFIFQENAFIAIILKQLQVSAGCNLQGTSERGDVGKGKTLGCVFFKARCDNSSKAESCPAIL